jgi:4-amino-4-deoxy-L-arabinose transferase-like glycosyltransferase
MLGFLFVSALALRLYGINQPPMEFHEVRQYHGALLARGFYEWLTTGTMRTLPLDGIIEPPILELAASLSYLLTGGEHLWIPRLLSTLFWLFGGAFLYLIARRLASPNAAVFSLFFYLFVPFSVFASRAFMPDPLMIMLLVMSVYAIFRYHEEPSTRRLMVAALASSLVVFVKPGICLFQVFGAFVALAICRRGVRRALLDPHLLTFVVLSVLPTGLYYWYGTFIAEFLHGQLSAKVKPHLLLEGLYWQRWLARVGEVVGYVAFLGAFLGILFARGGLPRALLIGLCSGYALFGLIFNQHIHSHNYYSLQLIPVVALSLAPVTDMVMKHLGRVGLPSYVGSIVFALFISVSILSAQTHRQTISQIAQQDSVARKYAHEVATYHEIGEVVNHSRRTLLLFGGGSDYGWPLMYHGRFSGKNWPYPWDLEWERQQRIRRASPEERIDALYPEHPPEFFVLTPQWWKSDEYIDLRVFLMDFHMTRANNYVVFDLSKRKDQIE